MAFEKIYTKVKIYDDITVEDIDLLRDCLESTNGTVEIDLEDADAEDSQVIAGLTAVLKQYLNQGLDISLLYPLQIIVHNLYRINYYPHPSLTVTDIRMDEPYG